MFCLASPALSSAVPLLEPLPVTKNTANESNGKLVHFPLFLIIFNCFYKKIKTSFFFKLRYFKLTV